MSTQKKAVAAVVVVSGHAMFAELLSEALARQDDMAPAGTAGTVEDAAALCAEVKPDVVVLDCALPDGDGLDAAERIIAAHPSARIIVLTTGPAPGILARAAGAGISGLFPMNGSLDALLETIRHARPGAMIVHPSLLVPVVQPTSSMAVPLLTRREKQVLTLLADGRDVRTTARSLNITISTCRGYVKSILAKLDARTQLQAVASARRMQLLA
jgi:DNA-binding NarL/FixJ family response regulator